MKKKSTTKTAADTAPKRAWHLARTPHEAATTEFEWSLLRFQQAWERWVTQLANVVGMGDLSYIEAVVMHVIRMQDRPKTAVQIARQLNRDDIPNVQYCLRKLEKMKLCRKVKQKTPKTFAYEVTETGRQLTDHYADLRRHVLTEQTMIIGQVDSKLREASKLINLLTGLYDQAGQVSATYNSMHERAVTNEPQP